MPERCSARAAITIVAPVLWDSSLAPRRLRAHSLPRACRTSGAQARRRD